MVRLIFAQFLVLDKQMRFDEAIKKSWVVTKSNEMNLIAFVFAMLVLCLIGFLGFLVGLLITIPLSQLCTASLYLLFSGQLNNTDKVNRSNLERLDFE